MENTYRILLQQIVLNEQHFRRGDITETMIRSTEVRKKYKAETNSPHDNLAEFQPGDIVIGNDDFGKYKNELQLVLLPHKDSRKNKVAAIRPEEQILLPFIAPWSKFRFTEKN